MITEKENYLMTMRGQQPEWVPYYRDACDWVMPFILLDHVRNQTMVDYFSVPWTINEAGPIADTRVQVMENVCDWKKYVHLPDLDSVDGEAIAKIDMADHTPEKAVASLCMVTIGGNFFIPLMNMMGFENGLCAFYEEPEAVKEFFEYLCDYEEKLVDWQVKYYNPDVMIIADDFCAAGGPMISMDTYNEFLRPLYKRLIDRIHSHGRICEFHMCGKGEKFIEDLVSLGVTAWEPAQPLNDLKALKEKYGNKLVFNGVWFTGSKAGLPGASEDVVRQSARDVIDQFAPGGGLVFWDGDPVGQSPDMLQKMVWLHDEATKYGKTFYQR